jgi:hypothetical protein
MDPLIERGAELTLLTRSLEWDIPWGPTTPRRGEPAFG